MDSRVTQKTTSCLIATPLPCLFDKDPCATGSLKLLYGVIKKKGMVYKYSSLSLECHTFVQLQSKSSCGPELKLRVMFGQVRSPQESTRDNS